MLPFRGQDWKKLEVLLIRRPPDGAWGIPKGLVDPGLRPQEAALMEALEEAGVEGELLSTTLGEFQYAKYGGLCRVLVFAMRVTEVHEKYPELDYRERQWFQIHEAAGLIGRPALQPMIRSLPALLGGKGL